MIYEYILCDSIRHRALQVLVIDVLMLYNGTEI